MDDVRSRYRRLFSDGNNPERLAFFSDAVFAIAMTLLVIDLQVPEDRGGTSGEVLLEAWPGFVAYALSFTIIAINWMAHYRKFRVIREHDSTLVILDLVLLFFVALLPFPTSLLSSYSGEAPAVVAYAFVVGMLSVMQWVMWEYSYRKGFVSKDVDDKLFRFVRINQLATPIVFWGSIPIALLVSGEAAMWSWFALFPVNVIIGRLHSRWN
ncbi:MAG: TMEM175 family protein [Rhodoglobus sp.]|nr:TMEM175 family protein [Rhodoglobus sp.]